MRDSKSNKIGWHARGADVEGSQRRACDVGIGAIPCLHHLPVLLALAFCAGCATMAHTSARPAAEVSACIADGWRKSPSSGHPVPVSLTRGEGYYFVAVELRATTFRGDLPAGTEHPLHAVWAEVHELPTGSRTRYHRAFQFTHERIDRVVAECQGARP